MGLQLDAQHRHYFRRDRSGGNRITRPRQYRRGEQQNVLTGLSRSRQRVMTGLGTGFDHVGEFVVGATTDAIQMIERGVQRRFVLAASRRSIMTDRRRSQNSSSRRLPDRLNCVARRINSSVSGVCLLRREKRERFMAINKSQSNGNTHGCRARILAVRAWAISCGGDPDNIRNGMPHPSTSRQAIPLLHSLAARVTLGMVLLALALMGSL